MMDRIFRCRHCGKKKIVNNHLVTSLNCDTCAGIMYELKSESKKKQDNQPVHTESETFIDIVMGLASQHNTIEATEVNIGRRENINGLIVDICRKAVDENNPQVPHIWAVRQAMRIERVTSKTARKYAKEIDDLGIFGTDRIHYIVNLDKAREFLNKKDENTFK